jgi:hypothetical protein
VKRQLSAGQANRFPHKGNKPISLLGQFCTF